MHVVERVADVVDARAAHADALQAYENALVQIENALVSGPGTDTARRSTADHAFVHRSHSGRYGLVNSEEGYQNLRRFLFGDFRIDVRLATDDITLPQAIEEQRRAGRSPPGPTAAPGPAPISQTKPFFAIG